MLTEGSKAPDFNLEDRSGAQHSLADFKEDYLVLYFYPKDNTPGCTIESRGFSKLEEKFFEAGARAIGISGGDAKSKEKFCSKYDLQNLMLADSEFELAEKYGIYGEKSFMGKKYMGITRASFVLNKEREVIKVYPKVKPAGHPEEVLEFVKSAK